MKKIIIVSLIATALALSILLLQHCSHQDTPEYSIGILQTASHPALDAAREGFEQTIRTQLGNKVAIIVRNAQGNVTNAHTIAQSYHANPDIAAIYAIATPAAQAMVAVEKTKPIIIAAVTDPQTAGLMVHGNVCGATDKIDGAQLVELATQLAPTARKVAILYNNAEANSLVQVEALRTALQTHNLEIVHGGVSSEADVPATVTSACLQADIILVPSDNTIASAMPLVAAIAQKHKKPLLASYSEAVKQGALAAYGVDYMVSGQQAAESALQVLAGSRPSSLPLIKPHSKLFINKQLLATLSIQLPTQLAATATLL